MKVVGATAPDHDEAAAGSPPPRRTTRRTGGADRPAPSRRAFKVASLLAVVGLLGTLIFGILYATKSSNAGPTQDPAVLSASRAFLTDFFNFNTKTVDADFNAVTGMATGAFSNQAKQFFNTSIRKALEEALAESRAGALPGRADREPGGGDGVGLRRDRPDLREQQDLLPPGRRGPARCRPAAGGRGVEDLERHRAEGATPASAGSSSGSSGSSVPGQ